MTHKDINDAHLSMSAWYAEKCDVVIHNTGRGDEYYWHESTSSMPVSKGNKWSIQDPRCREIIRERFLISTVWLENSGFWCADSSEIDGCSATGFPSTESAEIACLTAIFEAEI